MIGCGIRIVQFFGLILVITVVGMFLKADFSNNTQTAKSNTASRIDPKKELENERVRLANYAKESLCPQCKNSPIDSQEKTQEDTRTTGTPPGNMPGHRLSLTDVKKLIYASQFPYDKKFIRMGWEDAIVRQFFTLKPTAIAIEFTNQMYATVEIFEPDSDKVLIKGKRSDSIIKQILKLLNSYHIKPQMYVSQ